MSDFAAEIDTSGLNCPLPVLKARKALSALSTVQRLHLIATDRGVTYTGFLARFLQPLLGY